MTLVKTSSTNKYIYLINIPSRWCEGIHALDFGYFDILQLGVICTAGFTLLAFGFLLRWIEYTGSSLNPGVHQLPFTFHPMTMKSTGIILDP